MFKKICRGAFWVLCFLLTAKSNQALAITVTFTTVGAPCPGESATTARYSRVECSGSYYTLSATVNTTCTYTSSTCASAISPITLNLSGCTGCTTSPVTTTGCSCSSAQYCSCNATKTCTTCPNGLRVAESSHSKPLSSCLHCLGGFYNTAGTSDGSCATCPTPGTSTALDNNVITKCYETAGDKTDTTGSYNLSNNCPYVE